jgi:hypothetical protein
MKSGTNKTSIPMVATTNDDLKAIHSIEAILGIKNLDNHHHHQQQHLFPSHLLPPSKFGNKKRSSNEHYPDNSKFNHKRQFFYFYTILNRQINSS